MAAPFDDMREIEKEFGVPVDQHILDAENARLQAALQGIAGWPNPETDDIRAHAMRRIAHEALKTR